VVSPAARACYNRRVSHGLAEVEDALERYGLLLEHDKALPSVTSIVAGEPISGSWWGHALGHQIYDLIGRLEQRSGRLSTKIINGKVTYVHARLWPAFLSIAQADPAARLSAVSADAAALHATVHKHGPLRADSERVPSALRSATGELSKAIRALEGRLLVHSDSLHTESGAHVKVLRSWPQWCSEHSVRVPAVAVGEAKKELAAALGALCKDSGLVPKVPW
jgi:hypothetical protein